jgi:hypothetical protein
MTHRLMLSLLIAVPAFPIAACDGEDAALCDEVFARIESAGCNDPDADERAECEMALAGDACASEYRATLECAKSNDFVCDASGDAELQGCDDESRAYLQCVRLRNPRDSGADCEEVDGGTLCTVVDGG